MWFLPRKGLLVSSGEAVTVTASHDVVSVSYNVMNSQESCMPKDGIPEHNIYHPGLFEASMTPDRIGVLGHEPWREAVRLAAETAVSYFSTFVHFTCHRHPMLYVVHCS